jgi:hypothetical protein
LTTRAQRRGDRSGCSRTPVSDVPRSAPRDGSYCRGVGRSAGPVLANVTRNREPRVRRCTNGAARQEGGSSAQPLRVRRWRVWRTRGLRVAAGRSAALGRTKRSLDASGDPRRFSLGSTRRVVDHSSELRGVRTLRWASVQECPLKHPGSHKLTDCAGSRESRAGHRSHSRHRRR